MSGMKDLFGDTPYQRPTLPTPKAPETRSRRGDPTTSQQAAKAAAGTFTDRQRLVLRTFRENKGGLTDLELQGILNNMGSTYRTRRAELVEAGLIMDSGERRHQAGSNRIVWVLTARGEQVDLGG